MFTSKPKKSLGRAIADRVKGYTVWEKLPKKMLKKHPTAYVICPDFKVKLPKTKVLSKEATNQKHTFSIQIFSPNRTEAAKMLDEMIWYGKTEIIAGNFAFWLDAVRHSVQRKGPGFRADLTYIFKLRQLKLYEIKEFKTEVNHG